MAGDAVPLAPAPSGWTVDDVGRVAGDRAALRVGGRGTDGS